MPKQYPIKDQNLWIRGFLETVFKDKKANNSGFLIGFFQRIINQGFQWMPFQG